MSIAAFKKATILGLTSNKPTILPALQELGCLHLIAINKPSKSSLTTASTTVLDQFKASLRYLKESPEQGSPRLFWQKEAPQRIVDQILINQRALRESIDQRDLLQKRIRDVREWGHFQFPDLNDLGGIKLWFYKLPLKKLALLPKEYPLQEVYRNNQAVYIVLCAKEEPAVEDFAVYRIHTGSTALDELPQELELLNERVEDLIEERRNLTRYRYLLSKEIAQFIDQSELEKTKEKLLEQHEFFVMQGWIPEAKIPELHELGKALQIGIHLEEPNPEEQPPTLLESKTWLKGGHELVQFYQVPGYHALDPSLMVFFSFSLFFAMILADAGYGLILALITLLIWKRLGKRPSTQWLRPLLASITLFSIIYGVLLGTYWGIEPKPGTFLAQFHLINIHNFKAMMSLVIVIGCAHLCIGCGMRAWFAPQLYEKIEALGFILLIGSALLFAIATIHKIAVLQTIGTLSFILSALLIMFFASNEPVTGFKTFFKRVISGLNSLAELPTLFGDILSYLRLFALGLAGASLAITFNTMAHHIAQTSWVLAAIVLLLGQSLNFILCLMSAVIHGLRLNYIEFFKWSVKEDGYDYQPFNKQEITHE